MAIEAIEARLRARPEDWDSWLVYADWLLDRGDSRGQLVGLEHRLRQAGLSEGARAELQQEIDALVARHQGDWALAPEMPYTVEREWRHGFVWSVGLLWSEDLLEQFAELASRPAGRFLCALDLEFGELGPEQAAVLSRAEHPALTRLLLAHNRLGDEGAAALVQGGGLRSLAALDLGNNQISDEGVGVLARAPALGALTRLSLRSNDVWDEGAAALARSETLCRLEELDLGFNRIGDVGAQALGGSSALRSLRVLDVGDNEIGGAGVRAGLAGAGDAVLARQHRQRGGVGGAGRARAPRMRGRLVAPAHHSGSSSPAHNGLSPQRPGPGSRTGSLAMPAP
jgi:uncharacterized protein (TIGR02996 family)